MKEIISALPKLANFPPPQPWDDSFLRKIGERQQADLLTYNRTRMRNTSIVSREWSQQITALSHFLGSEYLTKTNAYSTPCPSWGFLPTEPQITKGWAYFISDGLTDSEKRLVVSHFCNSMCRSSGLYGPAICVEGAYDIEVRSEEPSGAKFIDLFISWKDINEKQDGFIVELKFDHKLTNGQLPCYRRLAKSMFYQGLNNRLFVIEPRTRTSTLRSLRNNKDWRLTNWDAFLREFERNLPSVGSDHRNQKFAAFRRIIWEKIQ
nr:hypothetical protein [uncultured Cohaesibacter sp.]